MAIALPLRPTSTQPKAYYLTQPFHAGGVAYNPSPHLAIDIVGTYRQPVYAVESGQVFAASWNAVPPGGTGWGIGGGYCILVNHFGEGRRVAKTTYAHLDSMAVRAGQYVMRGQLLGYVDSTGSSTGHHLHFATGEAKLGSDPRLYYSYVWLNPHRYMRAHTFANGSVGNGDLTGSWHLGRNTWIVNAGANMRAGPYLSSGIVRKTSAASQMAFLAHVTGSGYGGSTRWVKGYDPVTRRIVYAHSTLGRFG